MSMPAGPDTGPVEGVDTSHFLDDELVWCELRRSAAVRGRPGLFLDRDGVIVREVGYLHTPREAELIPGAAEIIRAANAADVPVIVVTNQAGIGRGIFGWADFDATQARIHDLLARDGAEIDAVYACPHIPGGHAPYGHDTHPARKPNPGMIHRGIDALAIDVGRSWIVGDRMGDMIAGHAGGLRGGLLVDSGIGTTVRDAAGPAPESPFDMRVVASIADAAGIVAEMVD